jgi:hypothetical protein
MAADQQVGLACTFAAAKALIMSEAHMDNARSSAWTSVAASRHTDVRSFDGGVRLAAPRPRTGAAGLCHYSASFQRGHLDLVFL